ncbi:MAG TPA: VWA domain-containing protein [Solirubrobacteraceae bacterium]|nr:VWA domain-containing protein [Solirubrobacteraceae bacterium]
MREDRSIDPAQRGGSTNHPGEGLPGPAGALTARLSALAEELRNQGVTAGVDALLDAHRALGAVCAEDRTDARLALRATMCSKRTDLEAFDAAFAKVFATGAQEGHPLSALGDLARSAVPHAGVPAGLGQESRRALDPRPVPAAFSDVETLTTKDFAQLSDAELASAHAIMARLARRGPQRHSRRTRPSRRRSHTPDLRRTLRASLRHAGDPIERRWRAPTMRQRPLVMICDVSGSMAPYARALLRYVQACVAARRRVEAFAFGTRLTRITRELAGRDPDAALRRATAAVADFSGGTRIGAAIGTLNRVHGRRIGRGSAIVILSDGWDRGDPEELAVEMARLRRSAHRVVWLNPLAAHPSYAPLTRGMQAALPHADHLLAGNTLASLEKLATVLEQM